MFFLLLAMMASSVLAIVLRYLNTGYAYGVYFINYVTCAVLAFATLEGKPCGPGIPPPCGWGRWPAFSISPPWQRMGTAFTKMEPYYPLFSLGY